MQNILNQCKKLYKEAFGEDELFDNLFFDLYFENSCRYITVGGEVVSMLVAIDVMANGKKGKYIYAVCTKKEHRKKGYMHKLFSAVKKEFMGEYDFLCLKPAHDWLYPIYEKEGFFKKMVMFENTPKKDGEKILTPKTLKAVREKLTPQKSVVYDTKFYGLLLGYCNAVTNDINNPNYLCITEKNGGRVIEYLDTEKIESQTVSVVYCKTNDYDGYYLGLPLS